MAVFKVETKNKVDIDKNPRVYFTCHPDDFEKYFKKVCADIFKTHDCAIFYTEDMTEVIADDEKETDLGRNNLFVIPVTFKLLATPNRAMDEDVPYALKQHIPVLPIMMEPGIDGFYSKKDKFGELQYLNPYSADPTEISYEEKLKKYLASVLISDELARRVRAAFDAYIFLSYRKKDRKHANELMRLIHSDPECRDIAIWFDEFLTPGESFKENIETILKDSKLFALLVTPNLLEEPDGEPNYVMGTEYPEARKSGITIFPTEMEQTDREKLVEKFEGIPTCLNPEDKAFHTLFLEAVSRIATEANNAPEHNFLVGLAYLEGVDVEVNREFAMEFITKAAEAGLVEAMCKLNEMYCNGIATKVDYGKAAKWSTEIYDYTSKTLGQEHIQTILSLKNLMFIYGELGDYKKSLELAEKTYNLRCKVLGEEHQETLISLADLASAYGKCGDRQKELDLAKKAYDLQCKVLGEEHSDTLMSLNNLALIYGALGKPKKALELNEKAYKLHRVIQGEDNLNTLIMLSNLASAYDHLGEHEKALELNEKAYNLYCKDHGEEHPDTLISLSNLALVYRNLGDYKKAVDLNKKAYELRCKVLGEEHPYTLLSLDNLAVAYGESGDHSKALKMSKRVYSQYCKVLGETHPDTLMSLSNLAYAYYDFGNQKKTLELREKAYELFSKHFGETHPNTQTALGNLVRSYMDAGDYGKAIELQEKLNEIRRRNTN